LKSPTLTRGEPLAEGDASLLSDLQHLFDRMAEEEVVVVPTAADQMLTDDSYLDALEVVELRTGGDLPKRARRYAELLSKAGDEALTDEERVDLGELRNLLAAVAEMTLSRANELSRSQSEPSWRPALLTTSRF
jgi:hypothetical protein